MNKKEQVLLFDLGNVLLPINLDLTFQAFATFSTKYHFEEIKHLTSSLGLWSMYEAGLQTDQEFRSFLKKELYMNCSDLEFDHAFNALLLSFPAETLELLEYFKNQFSGLYLLSNTSNIHANKFFSFRVGKEQSSIFDLFDKLYLSFELKLVKPDEAIYQAVANDLQIPFEQIIFFDDNPSNIDSAKKLGINANLIHPANAIQHIKNTLDNYVNE